MEERARGSWRGLKTCEGWRGEEAEEHTRRELTVRSSNFSCGFLARPQGPRTTCTQRRAALLKMGLRSAPVYNPEIETKGCSMSIKK